MNEEDIQGRFYVCNCLHTLESGIECTCFDRENYEEDIQGREYICNCLHSLFPAIECTCFDREDDEE